MRWDAFACEGLEVVFPDIEFIRENCYFSKYCNLHAHSLNLTFYIGKSSDERVYGIVSLTGTGEFLSLYLEEEKISLLLETLYGIIYDSRPDFDEAIEKFIMN